MTNQTATETSHLPATKPVRCNDQTFYIGGQPHQLVRKMSGQYCVCAIQQNPFSKAVNPELLRIKLHIGTLRSCVEFIDKQLFLKGEFLYDDNN